jgi:ribosomal protein L25 (general stress protein Ctc)
MTAIEMDFNRLQRLLTQGGRGAVQAMGQAIYAEAALALLESKEIVPVDTSALKQSGNLKPLRVEGNAVEVVIGYGGVAAPYAVDVHENLEARHQPGKSAKFLEIPVKRRVAGLGTRIVDAVQEALDDLV